MLFINKSYKIIARTESNNYLGHKIMMSGSVYESDYYNTIGYNDSIVILLHPFLTFIMREKLNNYQ